MAGKSFIRCCSNYKGNVSAGACWPAWNECVKQQIILINQSEVQIPPSCLPPPKSAVTVRITVQNHGSEERQDEQCLYVTAKQELHLHIRSGFKSWYSWVNIIIIIIILILWVNIMPCISIMQGHSFQR